jgi:phosphohistidine phosphatase
MDVYLVRHAIAEDRDSERWPDDAERPLTRDGIERFQRAAAGLRRVAPGVDTQLSSPYVRARQTAEILHDVTGWPEPEFSEALEAVSPPAAAVEVLKSVDANVTLALVGHEPFLSSLASLLLAGNDAAVSFELKKGGVICLAFPGTCKPGAAVLRWHATPKLLRRLDRDAATRR